MPGLDHGPSEHVETQTATTSARNARVGMVLFVVYLLLYGGFVGLNAFQPAVMDAVPFAGVNLAILYGFGLIIAALILAGLYGWLCRANVVETDAATGKSEGGG